MRSDEKQEKIIEARNLYSLYKNKNINKNNIKDLEKKTFFKNIQLPEKLNNNLNLKEIIEYDYIENNNNENNNNINNLSNINNYDIKNFEYNYEDDILSKEIKIKKIQEKYRSYHLRNKYLTEIKPSLLVKTKEYINKFHSQCSRYGEVNENEDFSFDNYQNFYPKDEPFFNFDKGKVFQNQIRLKNLDDPKNLEIYEGETNIKNLKHGFGILTTPYYMRGIWRNDEFTGWGEKLYRNGDSYEGKFINGKINGKGILKNKEGNIYFGDFIDDIRFGEGDLTTKNYHYIGEFRNNKFDGKGKIEFFNEGKTYEGQFQDNEIEGKGIYKWKSGDIYEGQMKKGKMDGYGKYIYSDGRIYDGEYVEGVKNGSGKYIYSKDKIYEGTFVDGLPDGEGFDTKDGHISKVLFDKGKFIKLIA